MSVSAPQSFIYPYTKKWVIFSALLSGLAIFFALALLKDIFAILLYFAFTSVLTMVILFIKYYYYSKREKEMSVNYPIEREETSQGNWLLRVVALVLMAILFFLSPLILSYFLDPLWLIITISGFVPGVSIPEVILYIYSARQAKKNSE